MKPKLIFFLIILIFQLLIINFAFAQTPANDPHWQLVWEDNFDVFDTDI